MRIYDLSLPIHPDLPVWPGDPPVVVERLASILDGSDANVSSIACGVHTGTHVDAPLHFIDGAQSVDLLDLSVLNGEVQVVDLRGVAMVTAEVLDAQGIEPKVRRLILKTDNSAKWASGAFETDFTALDVQAARWIVERGVQLVGIDYLSIAPFGDSVPTHRVLLDAGVVIVEGLNCSEVPAGSYILHCLPLKIAGSDGAPARVILVGD